MSKSELLEQLATLSRQELDEVADRVDSLRGGDVTAEERALVRERVAQYRAHPDDLSDLDDAVKEISSGKK